MKLSDHDLQQIDAPSRQNRTKKELLYLVLTLLDDLKEARERLNQNSRNSSVPSGSEPPWFRPSDDDENENEDDDDTVIPPPPKHADTEETPAEQDSQSNDSKTKSPKSSEAQPGQATGCTRLWAHSNTPDNGN